MTLDRVRIGQTVWIAAVQAGPGQSEALRLGVMPGRSVRVVQKIRGGPVVIDTGQAEVAVGYTLARRITVALESPAD